jgi:hypothetical protein
VKIKKIHNSNKEYEINFSKKNISKVLMYQTWSSTSTALNGDRTVAEFKAKKWVKLITYTGADANANTVPFTPTTVMELRDHEGKYKKHVFVINQVKVKNGHIVFCVSSINIDPNNTNKQIKKLKKIPVGEFHNARFDIDSWSAAHISVCVASPLECVVWALTGGSN